VFLLLDSSEYSFKYVSNLSFHHLPSLQKIVFGVSSFPNASLTLQSNNLLQECVISDKCFCRANGSLVISGIF